MAVHPEGLFELHHDESFWGLGLVPWENIRDITDYYIHPNGDEHGLNNVGGDAIRIEVYDVREVFKNVLLMQQSANAGEWYGRWLSRLIVRERGMKRRIWWKALGDILFFPKEITYFAETDEYVLHLPKKHLSDEFIQTMRHQLFLSVKSRAEQGDAESQLNLGRFYEEGKGVEQDYTQAMYWYQQAWESGKKRAACSISSLYENGYGVKQSYSEADTWAWKAIKAGEFYGHMIVGRMYEQGLGVKQNYKKAIDHYLSAERNDIWEGFYAIGRLWYEGLGLPQNYEKATDGYVFAAVGRVIDAQYALGHCYSQAIGLKRDDLFAYTWLSLAAQQGHAPAQYEVGLMCEHGIQVEKDLANAIYWYEHAAQQGVEKAQERLDSIREAARRKEEELTKQVETTGEETKSEETKKEEPKTERPKLNVDFIHMAQCSTVLTERERTVTGVRWLCIIFIVFWGISFEVGGWMKGEHTMWTMIVFDQWILIPNIIRSFLPNGLPIKPELYTATYDVLWYVFLVLQSIIHLFFVYALLVLAFTRRVLKEPIRELKLFKIEHPNFGDTITRMTSSPKKLNYGLPKDQLKALHRLLPVSNVFRYIDTKMMVGAAVVLGGFVVYWLTFRGESPFVQLFLDLF